MVTKPSSEQSGVGFSGRARLMNDQRNCWYDNVCNCYLCPEHKEWLMNYGADKDTLKGKLFAENNFRLRAVPRIRLSES